MAWPAHQPTAAPRSSASFGPPAASAPQPRPSTPRPRPAAPRSAQPGRTPARSAHHATTPPAQPHQDHPTRTISPDQLTQSDLNSHDRRQQFAEKLHAFTRDYGTRPNTRVKDVVDTILLIEDGLPSDGSLLEVVHRVFAVRATHPVPKILPDPPPAWAAEYPRLAAGLTLTRPTGGYLSRCVRRTCAAESRGELPLGTGRRAGAGVSARVRSARVAHRGPLRAVGSTFVRPPPRCRLGVKHWEAQLTQRYRSE